MEISALAASAALRDAPQTTSVSAAPDAGAAFNEAIAEVATASADPAFVHQVSHSGRMKPEQQFESFVLRSFVEEMLPDEKSSVFGGGPSAGIWRSMLAEQVADEMTRGGGIGIAELLSRDVKNAAKS